MEREKNRYCDGNRMERTQKMTEEKMYLPTQFLNPAVLKCIRFDGYPLERTVMSERTVYDYEFEFYLRSGGGIVINGTYVPFQAGEINIRKPGQVVLGVLPYDCYTLCVDFLGNPLRSGNYLLGLPEEAQALYENPLLSGLPDRMSPGKPDIMEGLLEKITRNVGNNDDFSTFQTKADLYQFFLLYLRILQVRIQREAPPRSGRQSVTSESTSQSRSALTG